MQHETDIVFPFAALMGVVAAMAQKDFILESGTDITVSYPAVARPVLPTAIGIPDARRWKDGL